MDSRHPKSVRRRLLTMLYERYLKDPLDMIPPEDLLEDGTIRREDLVPNAYYLYDRSLIELMIGYHPPMFAAARITANGIDLVENRYDFNLRFPPGLDELEEEMAEVPILMERLVQEADLSPLDGEVRKCLLRDVQYLRDEIARPATRWRRNVIATMLDWIGNHTANPEEDLPSLAPLRARIMETIASDAPRNT